MEDLDELVPGGLIGSMRAHGMRAAGRCADASLEHSRLVPYRLAREWLVGGRKP